MKTIQISNGKLSIDSDGAIQTVSGAQKAAQDIPNALLTDYKPELDTGSQLSSLVLTSEVAEVSLERTVYDTIYRWISRQVNSGQMDRIQRIERVLTRRIDSTTVVFYVEVLHSSGETAEYAMPLRETKLEHLLEINKVYKNG